MERRKFLTNISLSTLGLSVLPKVSSAKEYGDSLPYFHTDRVDANEEFDVIIIGGSYSGLSTAMSLARCLRKVLVIDTGVPRNRTVENANNFFGNDGLPPNEINKRVQKQLERYRSFIKISTAKATKVSGKDLDFTVAIENNTTYKSKKVVFATGCKDPLPDIKGFKELWGKQIHHCPYCHGFESTKGKTLLISNGLDGLELIGSLLHWCKDIVFCTNGMSVNEEPIKQFFAKEKIGLETKKIIAINKTPKSNQLQVELEDGLRLIFNNIYYHTKPIYQTTLATDIGCELDDTERLVVNEYMECSKSGLYAVGDIANKSIEQIIWAVHSGVMAAVSINNELIALKYANKQS